MENGLLEIKKLLRWTSIGGGKGIIRPLILAREYTNFITRASRFKPGSNQVAFALKDNPLVSKELAPILQALKLETANDPLISFSFDADGDRLYIFGRNGQPIPADWVAGLLAKEMSGFWLGARLVYDLRCSRGVLNDLRRYGVKLYSSRVGHSFIKQAMRENKADLGVELSGHYYFSETGGAESSALALLRILKLLNKYRRPLEELTKPFQSYQRRELSFPLTAKRSRAVLTRLKKIYATADKINQLDGLTVEYGDWWFNLRASNTEPVWRLAIEAKTQELLDIKLSELQKILRATS